MVAFRPPPGVRLSALLRGLADEQGFVDCAITGITQDSRSVKPGDLFLALDGTRARGHDFIADALAAGAPAVLWDKSGGIPALDVAKIAPGKVQRAAFIGVERLAQRMGEIAARFYGDPSGSLRVIAVTGTNGKTSCAHFVARVLNEDAPCGVLGTLGNGLVDRLAPATHTTPDAITLQSLLAQLRDGGAVAVAMEASSHALHQSRINGTHIETALFTNLSRDHLDYHSTMEDYGAAKARLFALPGLRHAVLNADDKYGRLLLTTLPAHINLVSYGLAGNRHGPRPAIYAEHVQLSGDGLQLRVHTPWGAGALRSGLLGRFNASNLLAVLGALLVSGVPFATALQRMAGLSTVPGRMERYGAPAQPLVVVDYAHTPDALQHVLVALREHCRGQLVCVFGCGGDRDRGKRPLMGRIAEQHADRVVVTDDNPRSEDPEHIAHAILAGLKHPESATVIHDRAKAIAHAVHASRPGDVILVAGKGHETHQIVGARQWPFADGECVRATLESYKEPPP